MGWEVAPRTLATQLGDFGLVAFRADAKRRNIEWKIPKLSHGSFFPSLLSPRRRIDRALHAVTIQTYVEKASTPIRR